MTPEDSKKAIAKIRAAKGAEVGSDPPTTPAPSGSGEPTSAEIFAAMGEFLKTHPEIAQKVQTTYLFKLKNPDAAYLVDLKNGSMSHGEAKADCTLEISDADFMALTAGKADAQKLYFGGKLKISGNVMASQKLETLFKAMTPEESKKALEAARAKGPAQTGAAAAASTGAQAKSVFDALSKKIASNAGLVKEVAAVVQFKVKSPDSSWVVDLATGSGAVKEGTVADAKTTITISDEDLGELAKGAASVQSLYQQGKLRVDGDVGPAHRLGFMSKLV
jgi:3-hydroxyacyl-CoA dehydrogenase/3a,7a,12a-trihydroxy-5b-cholest-24-enoyl-CoA hydratase